MYQSKYREKISQVSNMMICYYATAMRIQMSTTTKQLLDKVGGFYYEKRGSVHLKGKGKLNNMERCGSAYVISYGMP